MDFLLLLAALGVLELDSEALAALPAVAAGRERAGEEGGRAEEAGVGRRERDRAVVPEDGRGVGEVEVQRQRARLEGGRAEVCLSRAQVSGCTDVRV